MLRNKPHPRRRPERLLGGASRPDADAGLADHPQVAFEQCAIQHGDETIHHAEHVATTLIHHAQHNQATVLLWRVFANIAKSTSSVTTTRPSLRAASAISESAPPRSPSSKTLGTRWASRVKPATLQLLMRHKSIETTLKYYVNQDADEVADELWKAHSGLGNTLGNTPPKSTQKAEKGSDDVVGTPFSE